MASIGSKSLGPSKRVLAYIDGFNVYYGLKHASRDADSLHLRHGGDPRACLGRSLSWLDMQSLVLSQLKRSERCDGIYYFSAPRGVPERVAVSNRQHYIDSNERQRVYLEALSSLPLVEIVLGWYSENDPHTCRRCGAQWPRFEEKVTDVNIATRLVVYAYENAFDAAYVISGDADLVPALQVLRRLGKTVILGLFPGRKRAQQLRECAHDVRGMKIKRLRERQLPEVVQRPGLAPLRRPAHWRVPNGWPWMSPAPLQKSLYSE